MNIKRLIILTILVFSCNFLLLPTSYAVKKENVIESTHTKDKQVKEKVKTKEKPNNEAIKEKFNSKKKAKEAAKLLKQIKRDKKEFLQQIQLLDLSLKENEAQSKELKSKIHNSIKKRNSYKKEIQSLKLSIENRGELLKKKAISIQEGNGSSNYLEVLFDSTSFTSFIKRLDIMSEFIKADQSILDEQLEEMEKLESKQKQIQTQIENLKKSKIELESVKDIILDQQQQQQDLLKLINTKKITAIQQLNDLQNVSYRLPSSAPTPKDSLPNIAKVGYRWIGNSVYVFGGGRNTKDVAFGVFDCSSFVYWAYEQNGVKLGDRHSVSTETLNKMGRRIELSEINPGDIVFFDTYKVDGHVGIYVGNGKFIGAQSSTGVAIADMSTG